MEGNWNGAAGAYKKQYNGKEWADDLGLNMNDYGARWYDPAIGRWSNIDPKAESYLNFSPYHYGLNNPIKNIDPNGMNTIFFGPTGEFLGFYEDNLKDEVAVVDPDKVDKFKEDYKKRKHHLSDTEAQKLRDDFGFLQYVIHGLDVLWDRSMEKTEKSENVLDKNGNPIPFNPEYGAMLKIDYQKTTGNYIISLVNSTIHTGHSPITVSLEPTNISAHDHPEYEPYFEPVNYPGQSDKIIHKNGSIIYAKAVPFSGTSTPSEGDYRNSNGKMDNSRWMFQIIVDNKYYIFYKRNEDGTDFNFKVEKNKYFKQ